MSPPVAGAPLAPKEPAPWWGLAWGGVALAATLVALPIIGAFPFGILALDGLLAWGFLSLLRLTIGRIDAAATNGLIVALTPWLAVAFLGRLLAARQGFLLPLFLRYTILLEAGVLAFALGIYSVMRRRRMAARARTAKLTAGWAGAAVVAILLAVIVFTSTRLTAQGSALLGATLLLVATAVGLQWATGRWLGSERSLVLATGPALVLAAAQLLDGVVTYLAVRDPLGIAPGEFHEEVALSALLLEYSGVGFPLLKWLLALVVAYTIDRPRPTHLQMAPAKRLGFYLLITYLGLGPGLYSSSRLF